MSIANTLKRYLDQSCIAYETVPHPFSVSSQLIAEVAHVPGHRLAKGVLLRDDLGYLLAVLPSPLHIVVETLNEQLDRNLELVDEDEIASLFPDCDAGAVPPVGGAYQLEVALEVSLLDEPDIYFEAGDHVELVRVGGTDFQTLLKGARRLCFAC
ncbi:aminoacyl-tRNA deacylase [Mariprofundus ferrooxydans]|uniref:YbaK/prolyl-tRNA synthetase associated region n=1 Tax=Mariprofundus ferrooxydans PV-1 TaxID=314345 RepID=Q0EZ34_9PROT|nr:YbaK/EbsC family protein [Mariprofundus ferrooxydans]EAU54590.1 YbaK/prolyl-tRNA synthetase associated region [Mariprofundus ferrooxydans PV-1]KON48802.1 prolyl-tRNA synthetase [Mariprofundus ferrooxydans]